ncbi:DUF6580 family putative transport protein [Marinoscillum sp. MHG1-6]|uniref:DUF6580 family putative transport protein n=1 Tax=Marinoscillum sp. MHG1-6 TaxID=2959627 RepID=UPI002157DEDD|nr:DUF6580 family putative transport protein [Marinoscillum sp. MHG1-6]
MNKYFKDILLGALLVFVAVFSRVGLHTPNFTALAAVALFSGFYFRSYWSAIVPLAAVFISDLFIGFYSPGVMVLVYGAWVLTMMIGRWNWGTSQTRMGTVLKLAGKALMASGSFYLISNLGVWLFSGMYTLNITGLIECYVLAIPFFRQTIMGDLFYTALVFGTYFLAIYLSEDKKEVVAVPVKK